MEPKVYLYSDSWSLEAMCKDLRLEGSDLRLDLRLSMKDLNASLTTLGNSTSCKVMSEKCN